MSDSGGSAYSSPLHAAGAGEQGAGNEPAPDFREFLFVRGSAPAREGRPKRVVRPSLKVRERNAGVQGRQQLEAVYQKLIAESATPPATDVEKRRLKRAAVRETAAVADYRQRNSKRRVLQATASSYALQNYSHIGKFVQRPVALQCREQPDFSLVLSCKHGPRDTWPSLLSFCWPLSWPWRQA